MREVFRKGGTYKMCRQIAPDPKNLKRMPKYVYFQDPERGDSFIAHIASGCWLEIAGQDLFYLMNDMYNKLHEKEKSDEI